MHTWKIINQILFLSKKYPFRHFNNIYHIDSLEYVCTYVCVSVVYLYMYVGRTGVNVHTHFLVYPTRLENFSEENRMKLAAEIEFLP